MAGFVLAAGVGGGFAADDEHPAVAVDGDRQGLEAEELDAVLARVRFLGVDRGPFHVDAPAEGRVAAAVRQEAEEADGFPEAFRKEGGAKDDAALGVNGEGRLEEVGGDDCPLPRLLDRKPAPLAEAAVDPAVGGEPVDDVALVDVAGDQELAGWQHLDLGEAGVATVRAVVERRDPQTAAVSELAIDAAVGAVGDDQGARPLGASDGQVAGVGDDVPDPDDRPVGLDRHVVEAPAAAFRVRAPASVGGPWEHLSLMAEAAVEPPPFRETGERRGKRSFVVAVAGEEDLAVLLPRDGFRLQVTASRDFPSSGPERRREAVAAETSVETAIGADPGGGEVVPVAGDPVDSSQQLSAAAGFEVDDPADLPGLRQPRFDLGDPLRAEGPVGGIGGERPSGRGREQHGEADQCPLQPWDPDHRLKL